jgi:hypothetical protein
MLPAAMLSARAAPASNTIPAATDIAVNLLWFVIRHLLNVSVRSWSDSSFFSKPNNNRNSRADATLILHHKKGGLARVEAKW